MTTCSSRDGPSRPRPAGALQLRHRQPAWSARALSTTSRRTEPPEVDARARARAAPLDPGDVEQLLGEPLQPLGVARHARACGPSTSGEVPARRRREQLDGSCSEVIGVRSSCDAIDRNSSRCCTARRVSCSRRALSIASAARRPISTASSTSARVPEPVGRGRAERQRAELASRAINGTTMVLRVPSRRTSSTWRSSTQLARRSASPVISGS